MGRYVISRRRLLQLGAMLPIGAVVAACSTGDDGEERREAGSAGISVDPSAPEGIAPALTPIVPTATPEPFILPTGETQSLLMPGTPYETPFYIYGTGLPGPILTVLGGVHGNEPGGWLAAERLVQQVRPVAGGFLVVPRANRLAIDLFQRTTDEMGDLNRLYPGDANGQPMAQMAHQIVETLKAYRVTHVIDMHESWAFYRDRTETATGTAYLGQTVSSRGEPGESLARQVVETVNSTRVQLAHEELTFREWPPRDSVPGTPIAGFTGYRGSRSSLGLPMHVPGLAAILVEMGQQQDLERRVQLHVDVVQEALRILSA